MKDVAMLRMMASSSAFAKAKTGNKKNAGGGGGGVEQYGEGGRPDDENGTDRRSMAEERNDNVIHVSALRKRTEGVCARIKSERD
jgi:hypothetical protein